MEIVILEEAERGNYFFSLFLRESSDFFEPSDFDASALEELSAFESSDFDLDSLLEAESPFEEEDAEPVEDFLA
jgi:hypothetical protein